MYDIILGRDETDKKAFGAKGAIFLGKHYVTMEREKSLANKVLLDIARPHVVLISGKRGSGKSYSLGVVVEGIAGLPKSAKKNLATIVFDTMGIFWTMKYPNYRDNTTLTSWNLEPSQLNPKILVPKGVVDSYKEKGIPIDGAFAIPPAEVDYSQWSALFGIDLLSPEGLLLERAIADAMNRHKAVSIGDIVTAVQQDERSSDSEKLLLESKFSVVDKWGLFDEHAPSFDSLARSGETTILDLSMYGSVQSGDAVKALVIGFIAAKSLQSRLLARKVEEVKLIKEGGYLGKDLDALAGPKAPMLWMLIDEAHEFLPREGATLATLALKRILREGRQPGISVVLATQQPDSISADVLTQADIVISHRLTAKQDVSALNNIMQSYLSFEVQKYLDNLPRVKGAAIVLDDTAEKIYPIQVRPRLSWHGGEDPVALESSLKKEAQKATQENI